MTQEYYSLVTNNGLLKEAAANISGKVPINLTTMAIGDANGMSYNPDGSATSLVHEVYRTPLTHVAIDENNPNQLIIEAVINETIGPFYIREVGIFDSDGDLFAIGKYPETFKPDLPSGSGKRLYIRMILGFVSSPQVNLIISDDINNDPNFATNVNNALSVINHALLEFKNGAITDFTGAIMAFAMSTPPAGWLECNGAEISRITYNSLFNLIGTIYGDGDGSTTFNLPDLRGEFIRGWDNNRGLDIRRSFGSIQSAFVPDIPCQGWGTLGGPIGFVENGRLIVGSGYGEISEGLESLRAANHNLAINPEGNRPRNIAIMFAIKY
jgi:phage-related tail fiber protein